MAMARGIEGAAIGLLSPSVIELIVFRYFRELCQVKNLSIGAVAKYVVKRFAEFNHHEYYWSVEGDMARETFDTPPRRRKTEIKALRRRRRSPFTPHAARYSPSRRSNSHPHETHDPSNIRNGYESLQISGSL
jgi:hypothetical protein